jgi:hypothetical protein
MALRIDDEMRIERIAHRRQRPRDPIRSTSSYRPPRSSRTLVHAHRSRATHRHAGSRPIAPTRAPL